jgi:hypothetical protein
LPDRGNFPITSRVFAGLTLSKYAPVDGALHLPAMKFLKVLGIACLCSSVDAI